MNISDAFEEFTEKQITKLVSTWNKHKILRIAVDFDSTIFPWDDTEASTCTYVIYMLKKASELGAHITLFTCRDGYLLEKALNHCKQFDLHFNDINPTKPFQPHFSSKPYYNILLDDKAGLGESIYILSSAIEKYYKIYETNNKQRC